MGEQVQSRRAPVAFFVVVGLMLAAGGLAVWLDAQDEATDREEVRENVGTVADDFVAVPDTEPACRAVRYYVEGSARSVDLTMASANGGTEQMSKMSVPFRETIGCLASGAFVYVSAQNNGRHGTVGCRITLGGVEVSSNESSGAYVIASCDGLVP